ncbi:8868_t:CDS:2 [Cetraspora pellucida]|uniref:8868_t:CDS:1 n=1 Tax=Cetraspora pellucida TaxID=1433469 RepID=A0ACA9P6G0_9GLOM|nr:8868_t:CDS:2 [Cetraspora pellucida]
MRNPVEPGFFKKITRQESYPLLKIKDKSSFLDLPKNVYLAVETLTPEICKLIICNKKSNYQKTLECLTQEVSEYQTQEASEYQTQEASEYQNQETSEYQTQEALEYQIKEISKCQLQEHDDSINQDLILFKKRKQEIFELLDSTKTILEENILNPNGNKWLDDIDKNFGPIRKFVENCNQFKRQKQIPKTWKNRNHNTFWL